MANIDATTPVVVPATEGVTYDKWFLTSLIGKFEPNKAPMQIQLQRAAETVDGMKLMPRLGDGNASISFSLDMWKEMQGTPEIAQAMESVVTAVIAYAKKKNLL